MLCKSLSHMKQKNSNFNILTAIVKISILFHTTSLSEVNFVFFLGLTLVEIGDAKFCLYVISYFRYQMGISGF